MTLRILLPLRIVLKRKWEQLKWFGSLMVKIFLLRKVRKVANIIKFSHNYQNLQDPVNPLELRNKHNSHISIFSEQLQWVRLESPSGRMGREP